MPEAVRTIVQALQEPGEQICVSMEGLDVVVTLDANLFKAVESFAVVQGRPMPRCVGGDQFVAYSQKQQNGAAQRARPSNDYQGVGNQNYRQTSGSSSAWRHNYWVSHP